MNPTPQPPSANIAVWSRLRLYNYYRSALALLFLVLYINGWIEPLTSAGTFNKWLFFWSSITYLTVSIFFMLTISYRRPSPDTQIIIQTTVDILILLTLMHSVGGIRSGLGMLLIINISMTSLFLPIRSTLLFAAFTSLCLLALQAYDYLGGTASQTEYIQTGILGILLFAFAYLSSNLATRLRHTEQLAEAQSQELESAVQMSEHIISNMRTGIMVIGADGNIEMANKAARNLLSDSYISEGGKLEDVSPRLHERYIEWQFDANANAQTPIQQSHGMPDIQPGFSNIEPHRGRSGRTLVFLEDASQLNQRFQQMKLASLGRLTASIAHEIRNPLAAIHHASQLLDEAELEAADAKLTNIIHTQVNRLNTIVENVLHISRQQRGAPEQITLLNWMTLFRDEFCKSKQLPPEQFRIIIKPEDTEISFDPSQLHQVIWNMCSNALHHSGITQENIIISINGGFSFDAEQPYIDIIDNGEGIDAETAQQIFEPFYTTSAEGTGLGLYISKEVVESNRAKISHIALPTGGTCFRIYFMQTTSAAEAI